MEHILKTLFLDNPYIPEQVYAFCQQFPEFCKAEQDYRDFANQLRERLGEEESGNFEEIFSWYLSQYIHAYYLFGLGLRQEILSSLSREESSL